VTGRLKRRPGCLGLLAGASDGERCPRRTEERAGGAEAELANSLLAGPYKRGTVHREDSRSSSPASQLVFASRSSFFFHPPRPPGSSPCSSAHGRGWEEFSPAGSRAGPRAGLGLPMLVLAGLGANLQKRVIQGGCFSMVFVRWFCFRLCDAFLCSFPLLWFSSVSYSFMYGLFFCTVDAPRCGEYQD
jgi:hypothetical protein